MKVTAFLCGIFFVEFAMVEDLPVNFILEDYNDYDPDTPAPMSEDLPVNFILEDYNDCDPTNFTFEYDCDDYYTDNKTVNQSDSLEDTPALPDPYFTDRAIGSAFLNREKTVLATFFFLFWNYCW